MYISISKTTFIAIMVTGNLVTTVRTLAATSTLLRWVDHGGNCQSECSIDRSELLVFSFYLQSRFVDYDLCRWTTELQQTRRGTQATWATSWSTTLSSPGWRRFADAGDDEEDWPNQGLSLNSIAASLFENNWLSWQLVRQLWQTPQEQVRILWGASAH